MLTWGVAVQYSVFAVALDGDGLEEMMSEIAAIIDPEEDDVRLYRVPEKSGQWHGRDAVPDAFLLVGSSAPGKLGDNRKGS